MIEVTVQEAHEDYPIKKIILNDLDVGMERSIWVSSKIICLDKDNNFIYEEIMKLLLQIIFQMLFIYLNIAHKHYQNQMLRMMMHF